MARDVVAARGTLRPCGHDEADAVLGVINAASTIYEGVIPADCWHDPYMSRAKLASDMDAGVAFHGIDLSGALVAVMGLQRVRDVDLIRHAYVLPEHQGRGVGGALIRHIETQSARPILVGTWAAATWAIGFYQRHEYALTSERDKDRLLRTYWTVSQRQIETSVVLAKPAY